MSSAKKNPTIPDDQANTKIQRKFDSVFADNSKSGKEQNDNEIEFGSGIHDDLVMEKSGESDKGRASSDNSALGINLDFSLDDDQDTKGASAGTSTSVKVDEGSDLDFSLNFDLDEGLETRPAKTETKAEVSDNSGGFDLDDSDIAGETFNEGTKQTVRVNVDHLTNSNLDDFSLGEMNQVSTADHMTTEEAKANIETTIKNILRPKLDDDSTRVAVADMDSTEFSFSENTQSKGFALDSVLDDDAFTIDTGSSRKSQTQASMSNDSTGDFDITSLDTGFTIEDDIAEAATVVMTKAQIKDAPKQTSKQQEAPTHDQHSGMGISGSGVSSEDGMRFQATIRALREEREVMLSQIKTLKSDSKELEQDNLTLKANLDEAKIEIAILRKRHMVELEDIKYRLTLSDEKRAMADEKARQADMRREKLEQKVRIDFNQVKQREKELESKLELLSMDVDSQVQGRDQKILELRRKIDALEFNMENASIKEQKSLDDKRKLEDRLNKIMKTLRHSIKNLEDDIDHTHEDDDHQKEKN